MSEVERVLAAHQWHHTRDTHCACGFRTPLAQLAVEGYVAHVAEQIEALFVERERAAQAEAWDEGFADREHYDHRHDAENPYRIAQDAPPRTPVEAATRDAAELLGRIEGLE